MMMKTQLDIAKDAEISSAFLSLILAGLRRPSWKTAKKLASATGTTPELWLERDPAEIKISIGIPLTQKKRDSS